MVWKHVAPPFVLAMLAAGILPGPPAAHAGTETRGAQACELDIDRNGHPDLFVLMHADGASRFVAFLHDGWTYREVHSEAFAAAGPRLLLSCHSDTEARVTPAGEGKRSRETVATPGGFVEVSQPEGGSSAYYYEDGALKEVWTGD